MPVSYSFVELVVKQKRLQGERVWIISVVWLISGGALRFGAEEHV